MQIKRSRRCRRGSRNNSGDDRRGLKSRSTPPNTHPLEKSAVYID